MSTLMEPFEAKFGLPEQVKFCARCVISNQRPCSTVEHTSRPGEQKPTIHFDEDGVCDACRVAEQKEKIDWAERERELLDLCAKWRSPSGKFDCIVPGSGGKDSFYAAHVLKTKYGMHPLLVTWAPHIFTDWGRRNLERWTSLAPHVLVTPDREVHRFLTRLSLENLFHPFQPFVIGQKNLAPRLTVPTGIPLVFYGENESEYGNPIAENGPIRDQRYHSGSKDLALGGESIESLPLTDAQLAPYLPALDNFAQVHYLGYYLKWHPQSAYYYAVEHGEFECAPERSPGTYSKYNSIDDKVDDLHYWTTYIKFGIGRATYDAAQEIRSGEITREEGVSLVRKYDGEYPERFEKELFEYLSVPGFKPMTRDHLMDLACKFRSPHLWKCLGPYGTWELRERVS